MKIANKSLALEWLKSMKDSLVREMYSPPQFDEHLDRLVFTIVTAVAADESRPNLSGKSEIESLEIIKQKYAGLYMQTGQVAELKKNYSNTHKRATELSDARRQEDWATSWDHTKTFIFRMLTTIMIAAVVLGTGFLAHLWDIPLPMLRGI